MRLVWTITFVSLLATSALGQQHSAPNQV